MMHLTEVSARVALVHSTEGLFGEYDTLLRKQMRRNKRLSEIDAKLSMYGPFTEDANDC